MIDVAHMNQLYNKMFLTQTGGGFRELPTFETPTNGAVVASLPLTREVTGLSNLFKV